MSNGGRVVEVSFSQRASVLGDEEGLALAEAIRAGEPVGDVRFDRIYEPKWRAASEAHWSPAKIIRRVVELLGPREGETVLDVGSGVGKFCLLGALLSPAKFRGIERRPVLAEVAERARLRLGLEQVRFLCAHAMEVPWPECQHVYLYNPFEEHLMDYGARIDNTVLFSSPEFLHSVQETQRRLETLPPGTQVAHFWGFGGKMPAGYQLLHTEPHGIGELELWRKVR